MVTELVSHFHPTTVEPQTQMATADRYRFEIPSPVRTEHVDESQLSPVRTERMISSAPPGPLFSLSALFSAPAPVYVQAPVEPTVLGPIVVATSEAPVCDTAPPTPSVPVQTSDPSPVGATAVMPPLPLAPDAAETGMVPLHIHYSLFQQHQWLWQRYEQLFDTRETLIRLLTATDPTHVHLGGSALTRDVQMEIVHQIAETILTELRSSIAGLPSSSSGQVDRATVAALVERAITEFRGRIASLFGH